MPIELNHTNVHARDPATSARWLAELLGRPAPVRFGPFHAVELDNRVTLDFTEAGAQLTIEHYAFLVDDAAFDAIVGRIQGLGLLYWADPAHRQPGRINHHDGGRGVYWNDLDGQLPRDHHAAYGSG